MVEDDVEARSTRLKELEAVIDDGLPTFIKVGQALAEIRDEELWMLDGSTSFADYAGRRFGFGQSYAYRVAASARIVGELSPIGENIKNEAQARQLATVASTDGLRTARDVLRRALRSKKPLTAELLRDIWIRTRGGSPRTPSLSEARTDWRAVSARRTPVEVADQLAEQIERGRVDRAWVAGLVAELRRRIK